MTKGVRCATALIEEKVGLTVDLNAEVHDGLYPLHLAALRYNDKMIKLFIRHGARTDIRSGEKAKQILEHLGNKLPLEIALNKMCKHPLLFGWPLRRPVFELVVVLCMIPVCMDPRVPNAITSLVSSTKEIDKIFSSYSKEEELIQVTILLIVAKDRIMAPSTLEIVSGSMTLCQSIKEDLFNLLDAEVCLLMSKDTPKFRKRDLEERHKDERTVLKFKLMLLKLFERVGDAIYSNVILQQSELNIVPRKKVVEDVAAILLEAGIVLEGTVIDELSEIQYGWTAEDEVVVQSPACGVSSGGKTVKMLKGRLLGGEPTLCFLYDRKINLIPRRSFRHYSCSAIHVKNAQYKGATSAGRALPSKSGNLLMSLVSSLKWGIKHV